MRLEIFKNFKNCNYWNWNGYRIAWYVTKEKNKKPLLLIHGFGASSYHWRNNVDFFADNGFAVYMIDLLGFGESDQPGINEIGQIDNGLWCDQITDFINEIIRPINSNKVLLIGNSLGGLTALTCAVSIPEEISGIIVSPLPDKIKKISCDTILKPRYNILKIISVKFFAILLPIEFILFLINRFGLINYFLQFAYFKKDNIDNELLQMIKKPAKRSSAAKALRAMCVGMALRSHKLKSPFLLESLGKLKNVPFLLIWGEKDRFIPLFLGKRIANLHPWVKLEVISNSGHCVHDEDPYKFNDISIKWIKELKLF